MQDNNEWQKCVQMNIKAVGPFNVDVIIRSRRLFQQEFVRNKPVNACNKTPHCNTIDEHNPQDKFQ